MKNDEKLSQSRVNLQILPALCFWKHLKVWLIVVNLKVDFLQFPWTDEVEWVFSRCFEFWCLVFQTRYLSLNEREAKIKLVYRKVRKPVSAPPGGQKFFWTMA